MGTCEGTVAYPRTVNPPSGFGWSPAFAVIQTGPVTFTTDINTESLKRATTATRYVAISDGNNADSGLTWALAHKSIWDCINAVNQATTIYIEGSADPANPTMYDYDNAWRSNLAFDCNVIVVSDRTTLAPGYAVSSTYMVPGGAFLGTWALTADPDGPHVYEATLVAAPNQVIDDSTGTIVKLTSRASIALVEANPGSYFHGGGKLYVRRAASTAPSASLRALRASVVNGHTNSATTDLYIQGLTFEGGNARCMYLQACSSATFVDCTFRQGQTAGLELNFGVGVTNATATVYLIRCTGQGNAGDGLGATVNGSGMTVNWLEWDCESYGNSNGGTDQGSSLHFTVGNTAINVIRIGGNYHDNRTHGVADVGGVAEAGGCDTWMQGCTVQGNPDGVHVGGDAGEAWLHGCTIASGGDDLQADNAASVINVADTVYRTSSGPGTVQRYDPDFA